MKLTDIELSEWIQYVQDISGCFRTKIEISFLNCLLELKQRREEDRQREQQVKNGL